MQEDEVAAGMFPLRLVYSPNDAERPEPVAHPKEGMITIEVRKSELIDALTRRAADREIKNGAIVSLIGAVDAFTLSTMPASDATKDVLTHYTIPAEMSGTGEITDGQVHIHATMAIEGNRALAGHLHQADVGTWFARAYILPT